MYDDDIGGPTDEDRQAFAEVRHRLPQITEEEYDRAEAEVAFMELPFDLHNVLSTNPFVYDAGGTSRAMLGKMVEYTGGTAKTLDGVEIELTQCIGVIVGHEFGRAVIAFENEEHGWVYLGWVNPEDFHTINIFHENERWTH